MRQGFQYKSLKTPKGETVHALKDVNFTLKKGELLTVLGPSGCGKTTLLNITAGFLRPTSGKITLNNNEIDGPGVERGRFDDTNKMFVKPDKYDFHVTTQDAKNWAPKILKEIK